MLNSVFISQNPTFLYVQFLEYINWKVNAFHHI